MPDKGINGLFRPLFRFEAWRQDQKLEEFDVQRRCDLLKGEDRQVLLAALNGADIFRAHSGPLAQLVLSNALLDANALYLSADGEQRIHLNPFCKA